MIAELGSALLAARCGIFDDTLEMTAAYVGGWLKQLKKDKRFFLSAAGAAQKAVGEAVNKPVNALAAGPLVKHSIADLSAIGVKRVSLGSSLFAAAMDGLVTASKALLDEGDLAPIAAVRSYGKFHKFRKAGLI